MSANSAATYHFLTVCSVYTKYVEDARARWKSGKVPSCFITELFDSGLEKELTRSELYFVAGALVEAGSDTTRASLNQVVAAACAHPDRASGFQVGFRELGRRVGCGRGAGHDHCATPTEEGRGQRS